MATEVWHDLGRVPGSCTVCGLDDRLTMGEVRTQPSLGQRLRREPVATPARLVTCSGCGWRWTVRATDTPPVAVAALVGRHHPGDAELPTGAERRRSEVPAPRRASHAGPQLPPSPTRAAVTWDVLPCPRDRRRGTGPLR